MRRARLPLLCLLILSCSMIGCASRRALLRGIEKERLGLDEIALRGSISRITILDERDSVTTTPIDLPLFSLPGMDHQVRPALADSLRTMIDAEVRNRIGQGNDSLAVEVRLIEGAQKFQATWNEEIETVFWVTEVRVTGPGGEARGRSTAQYSHGSMDASRRFINELFGAVLRYSVASALDKAGKRLAGSETPEPESAEVSSPR